MSSVSTISHRERLLPQCFSANDVIIKRVSFHLCFKARPSATTFMWLGSRSCLESLRAVFRKLVHRF